MRIEPETPRREVYEELRPLLFSIAYGIVSSVSEAAMFYTDDVKADHERIQARGATFTVPPTKVTGSTIAMLGDTCGDLIQLTELAQPKSV